MWLQIPTRYQHPEIICYLLKEKVANWNVANLRKEFRGGKLRDPELETSYFQLERTFISNIFCVESNYRYILKKSGSEVETWGTGEEIYLDLINKRILFNK